MSNSEAKPTNEKSEPTILTLETAKEIAEMLKDGKSLKEIRKSISHHGHSINAWISESLLSDDIDHPLSTLRTALIQRTLKDTIILGMLNAAERPSEKTSRKTMILSELSKADRALLERDGHEAFLERAQDAILLKVEEPVEVIPPQTHLYNTFAKKMAGFMNVNSISVKNTEASVSHFEG